MKTRGEVIQVIARELGAMAKAYAAGDLARGEELVFAWTETVPSTPYINLILEAHAKLEPFNVGAITSDGVLDREKFARHVIAYAKRWQGYAKRWQANARAAKRKQPKPRKKPTKPKTARARARPTSGASAASRRGGSSRR